MNLTDILNSIFGKHVEHIEIVNKVGNNEKVIGFETKLYKIISVFGDKEIRYDYNEWTYKYKSIKFCRNQCYGISINDIRVYTSCGQYIDDDIYWKNDIITPECKSRVIKLVDELYNKALEKIESDRVSKLTNDRDKVKSGCMEL
jgi:hypothetical protein